MPVPFLVSEPAPLAMVPLIVVNPVPLTTMPPFPPCLLMTVFGPITKVGLEPRAAKLLIVSVVREQQAATAHVGQVDRVGGGEAAGDIDAHHAG